MMQGCEKSTNPLPVAAKKQTDPVSGSRSFLPSGSKPTGNVPGSEWGLWACSVVLYAPYPAHPSI